MSRGTSTKHHWQPVATGASLPGVHLDSYLPRRVKELLYEFLTTQLSNNNTREAYYRNICQLFDWCHDRRIAFVDIEPVSVAAYVESLRKTYAPKSIKQRLASIRKLYTFLQLNQVVPYNPAASVQSPREQTLEGLTPTLTAEEARTLLDSIDCSHVIGQRDRALISLMLFTFARVGASIQIRVKDFFRRGGAWRVRLREKGGKSRELPVHQEAAQNIVAYMEAARLVGSPNAYLFQTVEGRSRGVSGRGMHRNEVLAMVKRRARQAGLSPEICCHSFRATGLTETSQ